MRETPGPAFKNLTTLRLGGQAIALLEPETSADLAALEERAKALGGSLFYLGRGSNLLASGDRHALVLVSMAAFAEIRIMAERDGKVFVYAGAGAPLARLLRFCAREGLAGLEGLVGIPGTVGGACAMNAGSFGGAAGENLDALQILGPGGLEWAPKERLALAYRSLKVAGRPVLPLICGAIFALTSCASNVILQRMHLNFFKKKSGQPLQAWSAGCAFKNPPCGVAAGKLLEEAGFRGRRLGGMQFSLRHANFLVNTGEGTPEQALELLQAASGAVQAAAGITLEPEIRIIN